MLNQRGAGGIIVFALMVLVSLTLLGIISIRTSIIENKIVRASIINKQNFYAAESGIALSRLWLKENLEDTDYKDTEWVGSFSDALNEANNYSVEIVHQTEIDPVDGIEKVVLWGDSNGDYLFERNFEKGIPIEICVSTGTSNYDINKSAIRSESKVKVTLEYEYLFAMPDAALRVHSNVNGNGVSGSIIGESQYGSSCGDVADIMYDVAGGDIDYSGDMGDTPVITESGGMYPYPLLKPILEKNATQTLTPVGGKNDASEIDTDADNPGIIFVNGSTKITNLTGYGILVIDGDYDCAGNLDWHGLIIVGGDMVLSGGGSKIIYGAVVGMGDAVAINGSVDIQYDCDYLNSLDDKLAKYKMTSWTDNVQ